MRGTFIPTFVGKRFGLSRAADSTAKTNKLSGRTTLTCWNYLLELFSICAVNIVFIGPLIKRYWFQQHAIVLHENTSSKASLAMSKTLRRCGPNVCCLPLSAVSWKDAWRGGCQLKSMHKIWCLASPKKNRQKLVSTHAMKQNMFFSSSKFFILHLLHTFECHFVHVFVLTHWEPNVDEVHLDGVSWNFGTDHMKNSACGGPDPWGYANFRDSRDFSEGDRSVQKSFYATKALGNKTFLDFWIVTIENVSLICWSNFRGFYCLKWVEAKWCIKCLGQCFVDFSSMDVDKLTNPKVQVARLKVTRWAS